MGGKGYSDNHSIYWGSPLDFFDELQNEFHFDLDPCTMPENPLGLLRFFTEADNGLIQPWSGRVYVNPPYGGTSLYQWFRKCYDEWQKETCEIIVMLAPSRGFDSKRYHTYICSCEGKPLKTGLTCNGYRKGIEVRMLAGRLKFVDLTSPNKTVDMAGTFGSMLIIFRKGLNTAQENEV